MAKNNFSIVLPEEIEFLVKKIKEYNLEDIGSEDWIKSHEICIKLSQQAVYDVAVHNEEIIPELLTLHSKIKILIHEAILISVWKIKILPKILEIDTSLSATFFLYIILFHEVVTILLLELTLYHKSGCEALEETAIDLIDFCVMNINQMIGLVSTGYNEESIPYNLEAAALNEHDRQKKDMIFNIGIMSLNILNQLIDKQSVLPLSAGSRMVKNHDIPLLLAEILHLRPWLRKTKRGFEKYTNGKWQEVKSEELSKVTNTEAQTWIQFHQVLLNPTLMANYEFNNFRMNKISKCQGYLNDVLLDQIPPLAQLKHYLCTLMTCRNQNQSKSKQDFILEEIPVIRDNIIKHTEEFGGFGKIAIMQSKTFKLDQENTFKLAKRFDDFYNIDKMIEIDDRVHDNAQSIGICKLCHKEASKKCSNCRSAYYCSRECQTKDWDNHKEICLQQISDD